MQRKCACGGSAGLSGECEECRKKKVQGIQTKLTISGPGDQYEREADRIADQVLAMPSRPAAQAAPVSVQRVAKYNSGQAESAPASVDRVLAGSGKVLEPRLRQDMEARFGHDFSAVRVHTDTAADRSARGINALAYTVGQDIVFGAGRFAPETGEGRRLLAHELTHVLQQPGSGDISRIGSGARGGMVREAGNQIMRQAAPPGACDSSNLGTLGPAFIKSEADVKKLKLKAKLLRTVKHPGEKDFVLYCPHRASISIGDLVPGTEAYFVGSGKVKGKDEVWAKVSGHDEYYWGFIKNDKYENVEHVDIPEQKITVERPKKDATEDRPKKGVCGPDVTKQLSNGVDNVRKDFRGKTEDQRDEMCDQIHSLVHGPVTWDFARLHVRSWMKGIRDTCATVVNDENEACCANSVQVDKECYYAGSANYVLFGAMCKLCFDHYLNKKSVDLGGVYRFRPKAMLSLIESYKSDAWNFKKSQQWATAGYNGWPSGASSPSGDCSKDCSSTCPLPFFIKGGADNEAFRARWCPHIDPLKACKGWTSNLWDLTTRKKQ